MIFMDLRHLQKADGINDAAMPDQRSHQAFEDIIRMKTILAGSLRTKSSDSFGN